MRSWLTLATVACISGCAPALPEASQAPAGLDRAAWMSRARWGVMVHYLADWKARDYGLRMDVEQWNKLVNGFDAEGLAGQLKSVGAGYLILTIGQNSGYYIAPNPTYDRLVALQPSKCSRRDLISEMSAALRQHGLKLIAYLPSGAPSADRVAREAVQWRNGPGPYPNREFQAKWEAIIRDWSLRWSTKVDGWWFDGCYWPNTMYRSKEPPNFESFAAAARAGNPESVVAFNPGVVPRLISVTPEEDYTAGEISDPAVLSIRRSADSKLDGKQIHVLSYLGQTWGRGEPRFTVNQAIQYSQDVQRRGGAITWDVPVELNGLLLEPFLVQLHAIGATLNPGATATNAPVKR